MRGSLQCVFQVKETLIFVLNSGTVSPRLCHAVLLCGWPQSDTAAGSGNGLNQSYVRRENTGTDKARRFPEFPGHLSFPVVARRKSRDPVYHPGKINRRGKSALLRYALRRKVGFMQFFQCLPEPGRKQIFRNRHTEGNQEGPAQRYPVNMEQARKTADVKLRIGETAVDHSACVRHHRMGPRRRPRPRQTQNIQRQRQRR